LIVELDVVDHYTETNTNNVNKTRAPLRTTGGNDEPNIVFMCKCDCTSIFQLCNYRIPTCITYILFIDSTL